jgi:hypothetical protein
VAKKEPITLIAITTGLTLLIISSGSIHMTLANHGINVQTDTNQKQECNTDSGSSSISDSCTASSSNTITQSGGTTFDIHEKKVTQGPTIKPPGLVTVIKHVVGGHAKPSDFLMGVFSGCNGQTTSFPGSEKGTTVSLGPTSCSYAITEQGPFIHNYTNALSANCPRVLNPGDKQTCIVTNTFVPGDHI